jgi:hypothetical protein
MFKVGPLSFNALKAIRLKGTAPLSSATPFLTIIVGVERLSPNGRQLARAFRQSSGESPSARHVVPFADVQRPRARTGRPLGYLRQTLSLAMQGLPHGLPLAQLCVFASAALLLKQEPMNCCRASPLIPTACAIQSE